MSWYVHLNIPSLMRSEFGPFTSKKKALKEAQALERHGFKVVEKVFKKISKKDAEAFRKNGVQIFATRDNKKCSKRSWRMVTMEFAPEFLA